MQPLPLRLLSLCVFERTSTSGGGTDGETWTDETGDLATLSIGHGRWYESDFYIVTQGEGVIAKRNFE